MQKITSVTDLKDAIRQLEAKQADDKQKLREELHFTLERLKPVNMIKSGINDVFSPVFINDIFGTVLGNTAGFVSKKVLIGATRNPIRKLFGTIIQTAISSLLAKHSDVIKAAAIVLIKSAFNKKSAPE